jgi:hypothetical protein
MRRLVADVSGTVRPQAGDKMRTVDASQSQKAFEIAKWALGIIKAHPEEGVHAMETISFWAAADRGEEDSEHARDLVRTLTAAGKKITPELLAMTKGKDNPTADVFMPTLIRGWEPKHKDNDFPVDQPAAIVTQYGMDQLLNAGVVTKENFDNAFVTNICNAIGEPPRVEGEYVVIGGVYLKRANDSAPTDEMDQSAEQDAGITYTESWVDRMAEARRYTPFGTIATVRTWISLWELSGLDWITMKQRGGRHFIVMATYLACEWACRTSTSVLPAKFKDTVGDGLAGSILEKWISGDNNVKIPQWMATWRKPMKYNYITGEDVGFAPKPSRQLYAWSKEQRLKGVRISSAVPGDKSVVVVDETRMPFIEREEGAFPLQDAALTNMGPLRAFLCLSCAVETCGSLHLDEDDEAEGGISDPPPFRTYYEGMLRRLGADPGRVGKKVGGTVGMMYRLLLTDLIIMTPTVEIPTDPSVVEPFQAFPRMKRHYDDKMLQLLSHTLTPMPEGGDPDAVRSMGLDRRKLATVICDREPELAPGLMAIFEKFSGSDEAIERHAFTNHSKKISDVLTHLAHATSAEGYLRSCQAAIPVDSYVSHAQRMVREGIDTTIKRPCHVYERELLEEAFSSVQTPTGRQFYEHLHALSNSKSAGWDRIGFKVAASDVMDLPDFGSDDTEGHVSNRKDVMHFSAPFVLTKDYLWRKAGPDAPLPMGIRSVAGRKLRPVYNVPKAQQAQLRPFYKALEQYMKSSPDGFALAKRKGVPVADRVNSINASIRAANDGAIVILAHDATRLDQHIGPAHRSESWEKVLEERFTEIPFAFLAMLEEAARDPPSGATFGDLVIHTLKCWDNAYYVHKVPGAPTQLLKIDSEPSGALITAVDNTVVIKGVLKVIEKGSGRTQLVREMWGDDCWVMHHITKDDNIVAIAREAEKLAKDGAGQKLDTVDGSVSGRSVHFLQILDIAGQEISRRIGIDHEKQQGSTRMPGEINELLDKLIKMASRGGNKILLNEMMLITIIEGSYTSLFGRQATTTFDSIAAPGGHCNMSLIGFGLPNSRLFLELMGPDLFPEGTVIEKPARREKPEDIGKLLKAKSGDTPARLNVGGQNVYDKSEGRPYTLNKLASMSSEVLLDNDRVVPLPRSGPIRKELERLEVIDEAYDQSVIRSGYIALGAVLQTKRLAPNFTEQALIKGGYIPRRHATTKLEKGTKFITPHKGLVLGKYKVTYKFGTTHFLFLPNWHYTDSANKLWSTYDLRMAGATLRSWQEEWHPFFGNGAENMCLLLGFTGIHAGLEAMRVNDGIARFSPAKHRHEITPEHVMDHLKRCDHGAREALLKSIYGFRDDEINRINDSYHKIDLYRSIKTASEYSSLPDVLKSASITKITELILLTSPQASAFMSPGAMDSDTRNVIITHMLSIMYELMNVTCSLPSPEAAARKFIAVPEIEITLV